MSGLVAPSEELFKRTATLVIDRHEFRDGPCNHDDCLEIIDDCVLRVARMLQPIDHEIKLQFSIMGLEHLKEVRIVGRGEQALTGCAKRYGAVQVSLMKEADGRFDLTL